MHILVNGKLHGAPERRVAKTGKPYVTAKLQVLQADGELLWISLRAFSATACDALLALGAGDAVALAGSIKVGTYTYAKTGELRVSVDMVADQVLTIYMVAKRRDASRQAASAPPPPPPPPTQAGFDDDSAWLDGFEGGRQ